MKGKPDFLKNVVLTVERRTERVTAKFHEQNKKAIFQPNRIVIETAEGTLVEARDHPEDSFTGQQRETPWNDIHIIYSVGEALWTYLNTPFLYTHPGFTRRRNFVDSSRGRNWRPLQVTFPDAVRGHTKQQISCFGPDGLLRRHDYTVDILGGAGLNYAEDYRNVDGVVIPTRRRLFPYESDDQLVKEPLLVAIDMGKSHFK